MHCGVPGSERDRESKSLIGAHGKITRAVLKYQFPRLGVSLPFVIDNRFLANENSQCTVD